MSSEIPEFPDFEEFQTWLDQVNDWPVVEGHRLQPRVVLSDHPALFESTYSTWAGDNDGSKFFIEVSPPEKPGPTRHDEFDTYLNRKRPEGWPIDDHLIECANALASYPDLYVKLCAAWLVNEERKQDQNILDNFSAPIALRFGRFLANHDPAKRVDWMLYCWEATAILLASIAVCEVRHHKLDATASAITPSKQLRGFWNLRTVIEVLDGIIDANADVPILSRTQSVRLSSDFSSLVAEIDQVRAPRNQRSHLEPMNEAKAMALLRQHVPKLRNLLDQLSFFADVELASYERDAPQHLESHLMLELEGDFEAETLEFLEMWTYKGLITEKRAHNYWWVTEELRAQIVSRKDGRKDVYMRIDLGEPLLMSPLLSWDTSSEGHQRYLGYLSTVRGEKGSRVFEYCTFGDSKTFTRTGRHLERDLAALDRCFKTPTDHQRVSGKPAARRPETVA